MTEIHRSVNFLKKVVLGHQTPDFHHFKNSSIHFSFYQHLLSPQTILSHLKEKAQLKLDFFDKLSAPGFKMKPGALLYAYAFRQIAGKLNSAGS